MYDKLSLTGFAANSELFATADCICPGQNFTYECSVVGGRFTVWRGSVIEAGCEITLFHSQFDMPSGAFEICNNEAVIGRSIIRENECYTSQLTILVTTDLDGRTVECSVDDGRENTVINTTTLLLTTSM